MSSSPVAGKGTRSNAGMMAPVSETGNEYEEREEGEEGRGWKVQFRVLVDINLMDGMVWHCYDVIR
ncbi:hypothetical protein C7212DRAFT_328806 [Tuber magnatum]|uniref:Uncharacterized protein n=1 Tax=Tuber magnatum TaxID=42249 RepID=A0A317SK07_9PEZI|nr:hypothetical protein C7212DRAFT_338904 [Tuber magnatum]PWW74759.1 hypothetical protein C7212DRAFT_328806 [Tuber magnatum]